MVMLFAKGRSYKAILDIRVNSCSNSSYSTKTEVVVQKLFQNIILKEIFQGIFLYYLYFSMKR